MAHVYQHAYGTHYKRKDVSDPQPYLDAGWFLSISDHEASLKAEVPAETSQEPVEEPVKAKRKYTKKPKAD